MRSLLLPLLVLAACTGREPEPSPAPPADEHAMVEDTLSWETEPPGLVAGQVVYVPVYSHIYFRDARRDIDLAATLSIRNTDAEHPVRVTAVRYYDSEGALVRSYPNTPRLLGPMASADYLVEQQDDTGGAGANFIVEWAAECAVTAPVIEAVMISASSSQGISFVTQGRVLKSRSAPPDTVETDA